MKDKLACCSVVLFYLSSTTRWYHVISMLEKLEDINGVIGIRNGRTEITMSKWKRTTGQTKHYTKTSNKTPTENQWTQVLRMYKQFLLHMWHPSWYSCYKPGDKSICKIAYHLLDIILQQNEYTKKKVYIERTLCLNVIYQITLEFTNERTP